MSILTDTYEPSIKFSDIVDITVAQWEPMAFRILDMTDEQLKTRLVDTFDHIVPMLHKSTVIQIAGEFHKTISSFLDLRVVGECWHEGGLKNGVFHFALWSEGYGKYIYELDFLIQKRKKILAAH